MFWVKHYSLDKTPGKANFQEKPTWPTSCSCVVRAADKGNWQKNVEKIAEFSGQTVCFSWRLETCKIVVFYG